MISRIGIEKCPGLVLRAAVVNCGQQALA